jgi:ppGpp synthetase/RelA/SpoT-type nucleotidyltranferase
MDIAAGLIGRHEQVVVRSRIKDCESAIASLRRRQEGKLFDPDTPDKYQLDILPDLAGVRVLVFPSVHQTSVLSAMAEAFFGVGG